MAASTNNAELLTDTDLLSFEKLDRASPDLWPEQIPGVAEFAAEKKLEAKSSDPPKWLADLENDDINLLQEYYMQRSNYCLNNLVGMGAGIQEEVPMSQDLTWEFGSLTTSQLIEKVRGLQNLAYQLGLDEAREMTRGKFLNILQRQNKRL